MKHLKMGLRGQLVLLFLLVSLIPLLVVSALAYLFGVTALENTIGKSLVQLAKDKMDRADRSVLGRLDDIRTQIKTIRRTVAETNRNSGRQPPRFALERDVRQFEEHAGPDSQIIITNSYGQVIQASDTSLYFQRIDAPWWHKAYHNGYGYDFIDDIQYAPEKHRHYLPVALPIRSDDSPTSTVVGVLRVIINLPELSELVKPTPEEDEIIKGIEIYIIDKSGKVIAAAPDSGYDFLAPIEMSDAAITAINAIKADSVYHGYKRGDEVDIRGEKMVYGWARTPHSKKLLFSLGLELQSELDNSNSPSKDLRWEFQNQGLALSQNATLSMIKKDSWWRVTENHKPTYVIRKESGQLNVYSQESVGKQNFRNWAVLVSQPASVAFQEVTKLTNRILTFTLISCLVVIPIALVVSQRIVTPIMQVASAARAIGHGEFDQEIPVTSRNEVGMLAEEFNAMRRNLKNAVEKLTKEEKKMTAIVNSLAEGLILVDQNHRVLHINPVAEYLLNVRSNQIGEDFTRIIQEPELTTIFRESQLQIALNKTVTSEVTLTHQGEKSVLRVVASPFLGENGFALGTVYVFLDITREKEIDQMKSDFISLVSHELRTPLTSIIGFVSLILDGKAGAINEKQLDSLTRVQRQSKRLAALITDLLDISRIESGRIQMKQEPISLMEIAKQRIEEIRPQADAKSIQLSLVAPEGSVGTSPSLPKIMGDEERMGQVFTNLIGNAIKFTPEKGEVVVKMKVDGNLLHVEVIDTGPGIPVEERQKVFDKFYQLSDIHTRQQGGSGLGLSITKSIIEEYGGTLWIDDGDQGSGSNFQFVLPLTGKSAQLL